MTGFFSAFSQGFGMISWLSCGLSVVGVIVGIIFGALPGLNAVTGVSVFLPVTFFLPPVPSIAFLMGLYVGGIYGGSITAILINTPGTPAAAATVLDGYQLTLQGKSRKALDTALYASVFGGIVSCIILTFCAPALASVAIKFGPAEYFTLGVFGMTIVATLTTGNLVKGLASACIGLFLSFIGLDPVLGTTRLTFGKTELLGGISTVPACIGIFAMTEVLLQAERLMKEGKSDMAMTAGPKLTWREFKSCLFSIARGSILGTIVGAIPATGTATAAFVSYNEAKRTSKNHENFGKGEIEGVAASESSNNAVTGGAFIPLLTLGVPGDPTTAVMLGALMVQGLTPGPSLFTREAPTMNALFISLLICNVIMLIVGIVGNRFYQNIIKIPKRILQPIIFSLCIIGTFAISNSSTDVLIMFILGILGYLMTKFGFPTTPIILSMILGNMTENYLRLGLTVCRGNYWKYLTNKPIAVFFMILTVLSLAFAAYREIETQKKRKTAQK